MVEEGKRRKAAKVTASEAMAADAVQQAGAMAANLASSTAASAATPVVVPVPVPVPVSPDKGTSRGDVDSILGGDDF